MATFFHSKKSMAYYLPEELVEELLLRLPVKSLTRFKSVSKTWHSMLTSPSFINNYNHHRRNSHHSQQIVVSKKWQFNCRSNPAAKGLIKLVAGPSMDFITHARYFAMGPLSNGIYCLVTSRGIAFCNPATRECLFTEAFPRLANGRRCRYGFGKLDMEYKVIVIFKSKSSQFSSFVYGLRSRQWKKIDMDGLELFKLQPNMELCPQSFVNGRCHWMIERKYTRGFRVLSFDFRDETFRFMEVPGGFGDGYRRVVDSSVFVLNDRLCAIFLSHVGYDNTEVKCVGVEIWMMMDYGVEESWREIYKVDHVYRGRIQRIVGIARKSIKEGDEDCIETLFFEDRVGRVVSCSNSLGYQKLDVCVLKGFVCWNTLGVSTYRETLERLYYDK